MNDSGATEYTYFKNSKKPQNQDEPQPTLHILYKN